MFLKSIQDLLWSRLDARKGEMLDMINNGSGQVRLIFNVPARGLIGYTTEFLTLTRGYGIMNHTFDSYQPMQSGQVGGRRQGVLFQWKLEKLPLMELCR